MVEGAADDGCKWKGEVVVAVVAHDEWWWGRSGLYNGAEEDIGGRGWLVVDWADAGLVAMKMWW